MSWDEDIAIFQRNIKSDSVPDEEKDFGESLSEDLWTDVFRGGSSVSSNEGGIGGSPVLPKRPGFVFNLTHGGFIYNRVGCVQ